ncbi:uncharacterized protein LOC129230544 [Uloborus diversus]|uniref:uncharacterized protein LOC129230544 n=1 Tax=Uloborus diversus TaxID=327109 RepID=UPI00240A8CA9|nr:uncharacterized protein LOC129230544 [Uloborus diversus]
MGKPKPEGKKKDVGKIKKTSQQYKLHRQKANARNQKYKSNLTEEKKEIIKAKARERYRKKKELGLIQPIAERSDREKRKQRKIWKNATTKYRKKISDNINTPSPLLEKDIQYPSTSRKNSGRKKVAKSRSKAYRDLAKKERENEKLKTKVQKYKQSWLRLKAASSASFTPRSRVENLLKGKRISSPIKRKLLFGEVLTDQLKENLKVKCSTQRDKQMFHRVICGKIIKKYRFLNLTRTFLSRRISSVSTSVNNLKYERSKRNKSISDYYQKLIRDFYEDDEHSKMSPCKRDYVTKSNERVQKRILTKTVKEIHKKLINQKKIKISYTTFCRMKPFWVVPPKMRDRETCACIKHENMEFITSKLHRLKVIEDKKPDSLFHLNLDDLKANIDLKQVFKYFSWQTVKESKQIKGNIKVITKMVKVEKSSTIEDIFQKLKVELPKYETHVKTMTHQAKALKTIKEGLQPNELCFHIDFSENYELKLHKEVQSMHFGASKKQICLHTVMMYANVAGKIEPKSFLHSL